MGLGSFFQIGVPIALRLVRTFLKSREGKWVEKAAARAIPLIDRVERTDAGPDAIEQRARAVFDARMRENPEFARQFLRREDAIDLITALVGTDEELKKEKGRPKITPGVVNNVLELAHIARNEN